jgi:hypothetical protein
MNKFGIPDSVLDSVRAVLEAGNKPTRQLKDPKKETLMGFQYKPGKVRVQVVDKKDVKDKEKKGYIHTEEVDEDDIAEAMEMHLKPHGTEGTHYTVHKVGKKLAAHGGIKVGEKLSDTQVDDARDSGVKVKHVKEDTEQVDEIIGMVGKTLVGMAVKPLVKLAAKAAVGGAALAAGGHVYDKVTGRKKNKEVKESGMGRIATDIRLGDKPGTGLKGFKKKSGDKYISKADAKLPKELAGGDTDAWKLGKSKPQKEEVEIDEKLTDDQKTLVKKALNIGGDRSKQLNKTSAPVKAAIYLAKMQKTRPGRPAAGPAGWQVKKDVTEKKHLDPVDHKDLKGSHADRKDKDIDNDGKVDDTDKYLHHRRKTVKKAMKEGAGTEKVRSSAQAAQLAKHYYAKAKQAQSSGSKEESAKMMSVAKTFYRKSEGEQAQEMGGRQVAAAESTEDTGPGEFYFNELEIQELEAAEDIVTEASEKRKFSGAKVGETERSGIRVTKPEKEGPEHIVMQARKVISVGKNHSGVEFKDGSKAKVDPNHAHAALNRYNQAKPTEKEHMQDTMNHSHAGFKHVASGKPMDHPDNPYKKQTRKLAGSDRRTDRAVSLMKHPDDEDLWLT